VIGKMRLLALTSWVQITLFGAGLLLLRSELLPERIAAVRMAAIVLTFGVSYHLVMRSIPGLTVAMLARGIGRPVLGCMAMALALTLLQAEVTAQPLVMLCMKVVLGALTYVGTVLGLWYLSGRPDGAESFFLDKLKWRPRVVAAASESK
jgi:hypothetical protein